MSLQNNHSKAGEDDKHLTEEIRRAYNLPKASRYMARFIVKLTLLQMTQVCLQIKSVHSTEGSLLMLARSPEGAHPVLLITQRLFQGTF